ncbi:MAG: two pore domain potassium channel family protein [Candidatus Omnitrophica bacterium]|nr:two pore domain potassium channel family protein [Candidatus Omnitrophota bacterium]
MVSINEFLKKVFLGNVSIDDEYIESGYKEQLSYLKKVWKDKTYGVERIVRLAICLIQFVYPTIFIRSIFGVLGTRARKVAVEAYIVLKLLFPLIVLYTGLYQHMLVIAIIIYLLTETIFHILGLIFLSDLHPFSISYRRSILLLFLHYLEVVFDFSVIYTAFDLLNKKLSPLSALYFSFVTNTTLGYGDIYPKSTPGQVAVIAQLIIFIMFVILFIDYFSSKSK